MDVAGGFGPRGDVVQNVDELQGPSFAALPNDENIMLKRFEKFSWKFYQVVALDGLCFANVEHLNNVSVTKAGGTAM